MNTTKRINAYTIDERDRRFSPYRIPYTPEAIAIVEEALNTIRIYELRAGLRKRGRRQTAHDNLVAAVAALLSDLMHRAVTSENNAGRIHLSRNTSLKHQTRYQADFEGRPVVEAIDLLSMPEIALAELWSSWGIRPSIPVARSGAMDLTTASLLNRSRVLL